MSELFEPLHILVFLVGWVLTTALLFWETRKAWRNGYQKALQDMLDANMPTSKDERWSPTVIRLVHQLLGRLDESAKKAESSD